MLISIRTLVNTTLFRLLVVLGFWAYTLRDQAPARALLHAIGWDNLGGITVTAEENVNVATLNQKLSNLESMITATNMNCAVQGAMQGQAIVPNSNFQGSAFQNNTLQNNQNVVLNSLSNTKPVKFAVFNTIADNKLPALNRLNPSSIEFVERPLTNSSTIIEDILAQFANLNLTEKEKATGISNLFEGEKIGLAAKEYSAGKLALKLSGTEGLPIAKLSLIQEALRKTLTQFPEITQVSFY